jgi:uncharacterized protein YndB with AHSA1/START domain
MPVKRSETAIAPAGPDFLIARVLDAPRAFVWKAWTEPEHVAQWWGPDGFSGTRDQLTAYLAKEGSR